MLKSKNITKQDSELFRQSVGKLRRIEHDGVMFDRPKPSLSSQSKSHAHNAAIHDIQDPYIIKAGDELLFKRPGNHWD